MRIIAGTWRGRRIEAPEGIRPMLDRERERLFGVLGARIEGAVFLDVFAGTGAASLEALSRGAARAILVENGRKVLPVLRRNLEALGAGDRARVLDISAFALPRSGEPGPGTVDVAVCTPPFPLLRDAAYRGRFAALFGYIGSTALASDGVFILEHPRDLDPDSLGVPGGCDDTRRTAASAISFWTGLQPPAPRPGTDP